jgi:hypothetical protein
MTTKFEVGKWYKRGDGELIRVVCVDAPSGFPVIGHDGTGFTDTYTTHGWRYYDEASPLHDLIPTPVEPKKKGVVWVNIRGDGYVSQFTRKDLADLGASLPGQNRIARIRVEWEEGRFDE